MSRIGSTITQIIYPSMGLRRARGWLFRLVRHRTTSIVVGLVMAVPAAWVELSGRFDAWWVEGLSLVLAATGVALIWTGLTGLPPDWIDDDARR